MTMKTASRLYNLFLWGVIVGVNLYLWNTLVHRIGPLEFYIFMILTPLSFVGCLLTYRKTRHGRLATLENAKRQNALSPEEYIAKRQEILKDQ